MVFLITMKYTNLFQNLGLAKNEALIYEALLDGGQLSITELADKTGIHRRNVYDTLGRIIEKGFAFEVFDTKENLYAPADPNKLREEVNQRQKELETALPHLETLYSSTPKKEEVYVLKGVEGWKTYMRQILRTKEEVYTFAGKGMWNEEVLGPFYRSFVAEAKRQELQFNFIFDASAKQNPGKDLGARFGYLPTAYATDSSIVIFGDHVVITSQPKEGGRDSSVVTVIINHAVAESYRRWWQLSWDTCVRQK